MERLAETILQSTGFDSNCCLLKSFGVIAAIWMTLNSVYKTWAAIKLHFLSRFLPLAEDLTQYPGWTLITGATDGIGLEYARQLARKGKKLIIVGRNAEKLKRAEAELKNEHNAPEVKCLQMDFSSDHLDAYDKMRAELEKLRIDILINNVGVAFSESKTYHKVDTELIWKQIQTNITSAIIMTRIVLPQMASRKKGVIVNLASMAARCPQGGRGIVYGQTKGFNLYFSQALAQEYSDLVVQTVCPGFVLTKMVKPFKKMDGFDQMAITTPVYVDSVIRQIGISEITAGHWWHAVQTLIINSLPQFVFDRTEKKINEQMG